MKDEDSELPADIIGASEVTAGEEAGTRCVLIVDDDVDFASSLAGLLSLEGYHTPIAHDPAAALDMLGRERIAVALVDVRLGLSDGVDLVRALRQRNPDLVCVMVTAYASIETAVEALKAGAYDYLSKPFYTEELLALLDRCFERIRLVEEKSRIAERLRQTQRLEAMGQLASGIAHDFNNILAVLYSNLRWLQERLEGQPDLCELVVDALDATRSGSELASRLLSFGARRMDETVIVDLGRELPPLMRVLVRTLGDKVAVVLDVAPDLHPVEIPTGQLESSLLNLALNARDAMPEGGRLVFAARNLMVTAEDARVASGLLPGAYVLLSVTDTGKGMPLAVRRRALEPLFSTKPSGEGNGLGLAMVDAFVRQAGGRLGIVSTPGEGTTINLYLPRARLTAA
ncbi:response regulator [Labrys neptuniae]|uniref:sensor histidine kinase n=1 Tax=Labrys TaxID=204476 RepID=UPI002891AACD|nr:response regulator [Labrys neptuniae]MDT3377209.1 response regulator [Labrys neptuniae]